jgi:hypothetical protein
MVDGLDDLAPGLPALVGGAGVSAASAWRDGARRVTRAPAVLLGVWLMTLSVSLPLALVLRGMIVHHLGGSLEAASAAAGVNYDWMQEFAEQAGGVGATLKPTVIGFGAFLDNASAFADHTPRPMIIAIAAVVYLALWTFVAGGIIDRYARNRPSRTHAFFAASGVHFFRFLRLGVVQWLVYALIFGVVHPLLFDRLFARLTHETTAERSAFAVRLVLYLVLALAVAGCSLVFDYAKVRAVVEDRHSMLAALAAGFRFVRRNGAAAGLYLMNVLVFTVCAALYALATLTGPGAAHGGLMMWTGLAIGQLYIVARLWVKLVFWASETALFQARLAHVGYIAAPQPVWPDSPAADAITPPGR